jgi:hypothetical protein
LFGSPNVPAPAETSADNDKLSAAALTKRLDASAFHEQSLIVYCSFS